MASPAKPKPQISMSSIIEKLNLFLEKRDQKQKIMIVSAFFAALFLADVFFLIRPVIGVFTQTIPELVSEKEKLRSLEDDQRNKKSLDAKWVDIKGKLSATENQLIDKKEVSSLLERLSKLAQSSQVKIITIKPLEAKDAGLDLTMMPYHMSAVASTHDLGRFLALLEGGDKFFRVTDLKISTNSTDERRHTIELSIETYAKTK